MPQSISKNFKLGHYQVAGRQNHRPAVTLMAHSAIYTGNPGVAANISHGLRPFRGWFGT